MQIGHDAAEREPTYKNIFATVFTRWRRSTGTQLMGGYTRVTLLQRVADTICGQSSIVCLDTAISRNLLDEECTSKGHQQVCRNAFTPLNGLLRFGGAAAAKYDGIYC